MNAPVNSIKTGDVDPVTHKMAAVDPPTLLKVREALAILKIGRTKLNEMMEADVVHRVKIGRATRITLSSIQRFVGDR